jgi:Pumilio-family RNA binding repeat
MESGERIHPSGQSVKFPSWSPIRRHARTDSALQEKHNLHIISSTKVVFSSTQRRGAHEKSSVEAKHLNHSLRNVRFNILQMTGMTDDSRLPVSNPRVTHCNSLRSEALYLSSSHPTIFFRFCRQQNRERVASDLLSIETSRLYGTQEKAPDRSSSFRESRASQEANLACEDSRNARSPNYRAIKGLKNTRTQKKKMRLSFNFESIESIHDHLMVICIKYAARRVGQQSSADTCSFPKAVSRHHNQVSRSTPLIAEDQILELSFKDKQSSMVMQQCIDSCDDQGLRVVSNLLLTNMDRLLKDPYGSYVAQHLMKVHKPSLERISNHVSQHLLEMATNEFSSRVIQSIFDIEQDFYIRLMPSIVQMFDQLIHSFSGSILLTKLVTVADDESVFAVFVKILEQNKEYLRKAYFNRMLSTLVSCCSEHMLDQVVELTTGYIWELMNDKFGNCMLQTYYRRSQVRGVQLIEKAAIDHFEEFLTRRYPKIMLINLLSENRAVKVAESLCRLLASADTSVLAPALQKRESFSLLLLMASSSSLELISSICRRILISIDEQYKTTRTDLDLELLHLNKKLAALSSQ